jgi:hypothetical protein
VDDRAIGALNLGYRVYYLLASRVGMSHRGASSDAAGRWLKRDGIDGSGIATLMGDAGQTNGAPILTMTLS